MQSLFVMFELGARWGAKKHLIPVLAPGVSHTVLTGPLTDLNTLQGDQPAQLHQLVDELAGTLGLSKSSPAAYHAQLDATLRAPASPNPEATTSLPRADSGGGTVGLNLSSEAQEILSTAAKRPDPSIMKVRTSAGTHIQVDEVDFTSGRSQREVARWVAAIRQLEELGLIEDEVGKGEVFQLTATGWEVGEQITDKQ